MLQRRVVTISILPCAGWLDRRHNLTEFKVMGASMLNGRSARTLLISLQRTVLRQVRFPTFFRAFTESLLFCCVFMAAGYVSLGHPVHAMLAPMVPVVFIMMMSMVLSGV